MKPLPGVPPTQLLVFERIVGNRRVTVNPRQWPIPMEERARLARMHEPEASNSPDGFRLATCVNPECKRPMVAMWHLWLREESRADNYSVVKEIHMCHACATDIYGAPTPDSPFTDGLTPAEAARRDCYACHHQAPPGTAIGHTCGAR